MDPKQAAPKPKPKVLPKKWTEVYPQNTKEGNEECKFWKALARDKDKNYLSTSNLAKKSGLDRKRVEEIIKKYSDAKNFNPPLIFAHPTQEEHWGYWERIPERLNKDDRSISQKDKDRRINKHISGLDEINLELDSQDIPDEIPNDDWSLDVIACNQTDLSYVDVFLATPVQKNVCPPYMTVWNAEVDPYEQVDVMTWKKRIDGKGEILITAQSTMDIVRSMNDSELANVYKHATKTHTICCKF